MPIGPLNRETTADLDLPDEVDELMREHVRFLYREGEASFAWLRLTMRESQKFCGACWHVSCCVAGSLT